MPWITFSAIDFLHLNLKESFKVFEYGGGGSTLFFLDRVKEVVTVEHNPEWFAKLKAKVVLRPQQVWNGQLIEAEDSVISNSKSIAKAEDYFSGDENYSEKTFRNYASFIDRYQDEYFDVVLIDGRVRPSCLRHACNKVKVGGYLILDNSERQYYFSDTRSYLEKYRVVQDEFGPLPYVPHFTRTTIWIKTEH